MTRMSIWRAEWFPQAGPGACDGRIYVTQNKALTIPRCVFGRVFSRA
jgi:hypothetical protein